MPFLRSMIISIAASLVLGVLLFFLCNGSPLRAHPAGASAGNSPGAFPRDGYAVLTLKDTYPDRLVRELLAREGISNTTGESSQWVFLDDFGELEQVPLDSYRDRVEPFDLRDDGYAERLRSFFVFRGDRRLFISLRGAPLDLEGRVKAALRDIPFSLSVLTPPRSVALPAILFIIASVLTLLLSGEALFMVFFLPLWAVLAGLGVPGFALIAVLVGFSRLLREPVREYFIARRYRKPENFRRGFFSGTLALPGTWILCLLFLLALGCIAIFGVLPLLTVFLGFVFFLVLLCLSLRTESYCGVHQGHVRFRPVPITGHALRLSSNSRVMVPFTLAALVLLFLPMLFSGNSLGISSAPASPVWTGWKSPVELNAEIYREHIRFQQAFSLVPLGLNGPSPSYLRYALAEDGLIDEREQDQFLSGDTGEIPPFPLEGLIDFLNNYTYTDSGFTPPYRGELICLLIVLCLCVPLILWDRRAQRIRRNLSMYMDKRIAA